MGEIVLKLYVVERQEPENSGLSMGSVGFSARVADAKRRPKFIIILPV